MTSSTAPHRSTFAVLVMLLVLVVIALFGAAAGRGYDGKDYVSGGGTDATNGTIRVNDAWLDVPTGVAPGAQAPLRVELANDSGRQDSLRVVSTPVAAVVRLVLHGKPVRRIGLAPWSARDLEWPTGGAGIQLVHLNRPLRAGQWFPITFRFQHSAPITLQITAGPLGRRAA